MNGIRVALVVGTRPQIIKSIPVMEEARRRGVDLEVVHTGQHYDELLSDTFFRSFEVAPASANLGVGSGSQGYQTGEVISRLDKHWKNNRPDSVLVPGDTNSALGAAIVASKLRMRLGHIEAGARCYDMQMQEEINRRVVDHVSGVMFAVSRSCKSNLEKEAVLGKVVLSGDTMYEVFVRSRSEVRRDDVLDRLGLDPGEYIVMTLHREENTASPDMIISLLSKLASLGRRVVFPVHPRTRAALGQQAMKVGKNVDLVEPLGYFSMMRLISTSLFVATDSGGLQKEAFWSKVPCVTLRERTEWTETTSLGVNLLAPPSKDVLPVFRRVLRNRSIIQKRLESAVNPFKASRGRPSALILGEIARG